MDYKLDDFKFYFALENRLEFSSDYSFFLVFKSEKDIDRLKNFIVNSISKGFEKIVDSLAKSPYSDTSHCLYILAILRGFRFRDDFIKFINESYNVNLFTYWADEEDEGFNE